MQFFIFFQLFFTVFFFCTPLSAEPPRKIPQDLVGEFTLGGKVPVFYWYRNDVYPGTEPLIYTSQQINANLAKIEKREQPCLTDTYLFAALDKYKADIAGKKIAVIGSITPWYESVVLFYGGCPTTIECNKIVSQDPRVETMTVDEYRQNPQVFDAILSISSIAHEGLGRYGDPIDPFGDRKAIDAMKPMLKDGGLLFLSVPVGQDCLTWNAHRIYGRMRLPMLFREWELFDAFGYLPEHMDLECGQYAKHLPVFVLKAAIPAGLMTPGSVAPFGAWSPGANLCHPIWGSGIFGLAGIAVLKVNGIYD